MTEKYGLKSSKHCKKQLIRDNDLLRSNDKVLAPFVHINVRDYIAQRVENICDSVYIAVVIVVLSEIYYGKK